MGCVPYWHPSGPLYRLGIFVLASFMVFGSYLNYDAIGAVAPDLKEEWNFSSSYIGALYSVYSLPNVILPMFGGALMDTLGTNKAALSFSLLCLVGSAAVAATPYFWVMMVGRFVFGLGAESLVVTQSSFLSRWFLGKELALSFGAALTISRLGSVTAFWSMPSISRDCGLQWAFVLGVGALLFSFSCTVLLALLQWVGERVLKQHPSTPPPQLCLGPRYEEVTPIAASPNEEAHLAQDVHVDYNCKMGLAAKDTKEVAGCPVDDIRGVVVPGLHEEEGASPQDATDRQDCFERRGLWKQTRGSLFFRRLLCFPLSFWLVTLACLVFYGSVFPFIAFSADYLKEEHDFSKTNAGLIASVITFTSMLFSPVFGWFVDCVGRRVTLLIAGMALMVPAFLMLALSPYTPIPWIVLIGMSFSLVPATLWPCVPILVETERVGTAFGVMTVCQNMGLLIVPYIIGRLKDETGSYMAGNLLLASMCAVGLVGAIWLFIHDWKSGGVLQLRAKG